MTKYLLLATTGKRIYMCREFVQSLNYIQDYQLVVVAQDYPNGYKIWLKNNLPKAHLIFKEEILGMHSAKVEGLKWMSSQSDNYLVCSVDDDMEFIKETNFAPIEKAIQYRNIGFISAGWVDHENKISKRKLKHEFVKQNIVYTGGGLFFRKDVADLIINMPDRKYISDNSAWSAHVYINGYSNWRYRGSLTIHKICSKDGRKELVRHYDCTTYDDVILRYRKGSKRLGIKNNFLIPNDKDLTEVAHELHKANKTVGEFAWGKIDLNDLDLQIRRQAERDGLGFREYIELYAAYENGLMVGFFGFQEKKDRIVLRNVYIFPMQRRRGLMKQINDFRIKEAFDRGFDLVEAKATKMSAPAYIKRGFTIKAKSRNFTTLHFTREQYENLS